MPHDGFTYVLDEESYTWVSTNKPPIYIGFSPSPIDAVSTLFSKLKLNASDKFVDLGCGDGQVAIAAAKCGMQATGVEVHPVLYSQSQIEAELANTPVTFIAGDLVSADLTPYTVIYMYLGRPLCEAVLPNIKKLAPGKIVISGDYCYPDWEPIATYAMGGVTFYVWKT
jgi:SAM-dependent methyltransferase